jgi:hypothetical protein
MYYLAIATDALHAFLMVIWILGLPLQFWQRFNRLSLIYCIFSIVFIIVNQVSQYTLGECVFTAIANWFYSHSNSGSTNEWFIVRMTKFIFGLTPTHKSIKIATEVLIGISAVGGVFRLMKRKCL